jgi:hypothetical protein
LAGPDLLADVLAWCKEHPATLPLPGSGQLEMRREHDGTVTVQGDAPDALAISADLLSVASSEYLTFTDGVLAMNVQPKPLRYRPIGPDPSSCTIVFERVQEA